MNPRAELPDEEPTPPWLADALDEVRVPAPRPELRDSLRARFVGVQGAQRALEDVQPREPAEAPALRRSTRRTRGAASATPTRRWRAGLLLLSGLVAASLVLWMLRPKALPRVELVDSALASLTLDGQPALEHEFERLLLGGARVRTAQTPARVRVDGVALIELAPNSELVLTPWSEAGGGEARIELARGGVRVATAPDFAPRKLTVFAPDAQIAIVGTEFGVDVLDGVGTCVCCTHGAIEVRPRGREQSERVLAGGMSFCFSSGEAPMLGAVKDDHAAEVVALRRFAWPAAKR